MYIYRLQIPHHGRMPVDHKRALLKDLGTCPQSNAESELPFQA